MSIKTGEINPDRESKRYESARNYHKGRGFKPLEH